jgi:hypothetical protein
MLFNESKKNLMMIVLEKIIIYVYLNSLRIFNFLAKYTSKI